MNRVVTLLGSFGLLAVAFCAEAADPPRWLGFNTYTPNAETTQGF